MIGGKWDIWDMNIQNVKKVQVLNNIIIQVQHRLWSAAPVLQPELPAEPGAGEAQLPDSLLQGWLNQDDTWLSQDDTWLCS